VTHVLTFLLAIEPVYYGVIDMALLSIIRRWHVRDEIPIREIERRTRLLHYAIRKYLRSETVEPKFRVPDSPNNLDLFY
jgi:hypothetical protein